LLVGGYLAFRITRSWLQGWLLQLTPFFSATCVLHLPRVCPEVLQLVIGAVYASALLLFLARRRDAAGFVWVFGIVNGLNIATKITAAPLALIPLMLLADWRERVRFVFITMLTLVLTTAPAWSQYDAIAAWVVKIATHTRMYGNGPTGLIDGALFGEFLRELCRAYFLHVVVIVGGGLTAAGLLWKTRGVSKRDDLRGLLAVSLAQLVQVLVVAKHPRLHYLMPTLALFGVNLVLLCRIVQGYPRVSKTRPRGFAAAGFVGIVVVWFAAFQGPALYDEVALLRQQSADRLAFAEQVERHAGSTILLGPGTYSLPQALFHGDTWAGSRYRDEITRRRPHARSVETDAYFDFGAMGNLAVELDRSQTILLHASRWMLPEAASGARLEPMFRSGDEVLYRVTRVPSEPVSMRFLRPRRERAF
jgi:hypothetical protein